MHSNNCSIINHVGEPFASSYNQGQAFCTNGGPSSAEHLSTFLYQLKRICLNVLVNRHRNIHRLRVRAILMCFAEK